MRAAAFAAVALCAVAALPVSARSDDVLHLLHGPDAGPVSNARLAAEMAALRELYFRCTLHVRHALDGKSTVTELLERSIRRECAEIYHFSTQHVRRLCGASEQGCSEAFHSRWSAALRDMAAGAAQAGTVIPVPAGRPNADRR